MKQPGKVIVRIKSGAWSARTIHTCNITISSGKDEIAYPDWPASERTIKATCERLVRKGKVRGNVVCEVEIGREIGKQNW